MTGYSFQFPEEAKMRLAGGCLAAVLALVLVVYIVGDVRTSYEYNREIGSFWDLSVKASTLDMKSDFLNRFVAAVDSAKLSGHNAIFFPTPDNDVTQNIATLKNLQHRMDEIRGMDVTSFAYQQAISQITAQEQDEAANMLGVIKGRWFLSHHPLYWDWITVLCYLALIGALGIIGLVALADL